MKTSSRALALCLALFARSAFAQATASAPATTSPATTAPATLADDLARIQKAMLVKNLQELDDALKEQAKTRFPAWKTAAESGDAIGQYFLGRCYLTGAGIPRSTVDGAAWLRKAADQKLAIAAEELGNCYKYGHGVRASYPDALTWYQTAADLGLPTAWDDVGDMLADEDGAMSVRGEKHFSADPRKAFEAFQKGAERGDTWAMFELGKMHEDGKAPNSTKPEAEKWLRLSAEGGNILAMFELGRYYRDESQFEEALKWLKKAVDAGDVHHQAVMLMADMYENGDGVTASHAEAVRLYEIADNAGEQEAEEWLARNR